MQDKFEGALVGLAVGDAVGTTLEFKPRGSFIPITDMEGGGPFRLKKGEWTDDTSMALCLTHSLLTRKEFDPADQMNRYWPPGYLRVNQQILQVNTMSENRVCTRTHLSILTAFVLSGGLSLTAITELVTAIQGTDQIALFAAGQNERDFLSANLGTSEGGDQSLQAGDALSGTEAMTL